MLRVGVGVRARVGGRGSARVGGCGQGLGWWVGLGLGLGLGVSAGRRQVRTSQVPASAISRNLAAYSLPMLPRGGVSRPSFLNHSMSCWVRVGGGVG